MRRAALIVALLLAVPAVLAAFGIPGVALAFDAFRRTDVGWEAPGPRQLGLLWRGVWLSIAGAAAAQLTGAGLAVGLASPNRWLRTVSTFAGLTTLLTPGYLFAYAWSLPLLPEGVFVGAARAERVPTWLSREGRALVCLATWLAPVAAVFLTAAWHAGGRSNYRLSLLDARRPRAWLAAAFLVGGPWIAASLCLCGLLALTEYSIPHLCQAYTANTELLAELQALERPALVSATPLLVVVAIFTVGTTWVWRHAARAAAITVTTPEIDGRGRAGPLAIAAWIAVLVILLAPLGLLVAHLHDFSAIVRVVRFYAADLLTMAPIGLVSAAGAMSLAVCIGWLAHLGRRSRHIADALTAVSILSAVMPPALLGEGLLLGLLQTGPMGESFVAVSLVGIARFAVLPILAARLLGPAQELVDQARSDGASRTDSYLQVTLPTQLPLLLAASLAVAVLSAGEIGAAQLVVPPGVNSLARTMLNEIHFGRNDDIIALALWQIAICAAAAGLLARPLRRRMRHENPDHQR